MTATVDKRIVEMAFQNDKFEQGVGTSLTTIEKLKKSLNFSDAEKSFDGVTNAASRVNLNSITDGVQKVSNGFSAMGIFAITTLVNIANSAYQAGLAIAKALVITPVTTGFNEFELKMGAIQTIMAGSGESLEVVNKKLAELNEYSDRTIYSFADMTQNIGKFTNAGVSLDQSVASIKGIANVAALSGANANEAARAMYNFAQALSSGSVKLIDWKSIELANMGTVEFKNQLIDAAVAQGTLTRATDGTLRTLKGTALSATKGFNESLQDQWLTTNVLVGVLNDYADATTEIGARATAAAQDVKTFSQLFSTLKESAQSGWAETWELIIGDFEEGKKFLTELNKFVGGLIGASADARNGLIGGWKELGGRTKLIEAFENVLNGIVKVVNPIRDAFRTIFPPATAKQLVAITEGLVNLTNKLQLSEDGATKLGRIFKGVFAVFDIIKMAVSALGRGLGTLLQSLLPVGTGFVDILASTGDWLLALRDSIKTTDIFNKVVDKIVFYVGAAVVGIKAFGTAIKEAFDKFKSSSEVNGFLRGFLDSVKSFFAFFTNSDSDFKGISSFVDKVKERFGPLGDLLERVGTFFDNFFTKISPVTAKATQFKDAVVRVLGNIADSIITWITELDFSKINFDATFDKINTALLSGLLFSITRFVNKGGGIFDRITDVFKDMRGFADSATGILDSLTGVLTGVKQSLEAWQKDLRAGILLKIASAIALLSVSLIALSMVDSQKLTMALTAVTVLFGDLFGAMAAYEKISGTTGTLAMTKGVVGMLGMSAAILMLAGALTSLAKIEPEDLVKGVLAIAALTTVLITTASIMSKNTGIVMKGSLSMIVFALALRTFIGPLETLGAMDAGAMTQGLLGLGAILAALSIFMASINFKGSALDDMLAIFILGAAVSDLSGVVMEFANLDSGSLLQGLSVLGILLAELMAFTKLATGGGNFVLTAVGMLVLSGAMLVLSDVLEKIGGMTTDELIRGLAGLAGSLLILGVAMKAMSGSIVGAAALVVAAGALMLLVPSLKILGSMSLEQIGIGLLAMAGSFTVLGLAASILTPLLPSLLLLAVAMAALGVAALAVGVGVLAFATGLATLAAIGAASGVAIAGLLIAVAAVLPTLATALATSIITFATTIKEGAPILFEAGKTMFLGFIKSISETAPEVVDMFLTFVSTLLSKVKEKLPEIVQSGYDILIGFLTGVRNNIGQVVTLAYEIVTEYLNAIAGRLPELIDAGFNLIISFIDGLTLAVDEHLPQLMMSVQALGIAIVQGVVEGLIGGKHQAVEGIKKLGQTLLDEFKRFFGINSPSTVFMALALDLIRGLVLGFKNNVLSVVNAVTELARNMVNKLKEKTEEFKTAGKDFVLGLANGIKQYVGTAINAAANLAKEVLAKIKSVFDEHSPSGETFKSGENLDKGLAGGIKKFAGLVLASTKDLGDDTIAGFGNIVSRISDAINSDIDINPTIRPIVDLSNIQASGSKLDSIFGEKRLDLSVTASKASNVAGSISSSLDTSSVSDVKDAAKTPTIEFTQNNYSPKELSRIDIYRQTKNQLSQAKELVGA